MRPCGIEYDILNAEQVLAPYLESEGQLPGATLQWYTAAMLHACVVRVCDKGSVKSDDLHNRCPLYALSAFQTSHHNSHAGSVMCDWSNAHVSKMASAQHPRHL